MPDERRCKNAAYALCEWGNGGRYKFCLSHFTDFKSRRLVAGVVQLAFSGQCDCNGWELKYHIKKRLEELEAERGRVDA